MTERILRYFLMICCAVLLVLWLVGGTMMRGNWQDHIQAELTNEAAILLQEVEKNGAEDLAASQLSHPFCCTGAGGELLFVSSGAEQYLNDTTSLQGQAEAADGLRVIVYDEASFRDYFLLPFLYLLLFFVSLTLLTFKLLLPWLKRKMMLRLSKIDLEKPESPEDHDYPELYPFLKRIRQQNRTIQYQLTELHKSQQTFTAITGNMSEGFILTDNQGNVLSYNDGALKLLGAEPDQEGRNALSSNKIFRDVTAEALCGRRKEQVVDLPERCCQFIASPVIENGQVRGVVIVILDITEKEHRYRLRRDFTANVSHELKTPLTSISGFAEIISQGITDEKTTREFAGDIYNESKRLITLVNDIIKLAELEDTELNREKMPVDLYELSEKVLQELKPSADKKAIQLQLTGRPVKIKGVYRILEEMIYNLCDNAIKYNKPEGQVRVALAEDAEFVRLSVEDTGIGIPKSAQNRVFERFYRVDKSHSKKIGGTGLGLSIVKHGANIHHAEIHMESEENQGTKIELCFPL